MLGFELLVKLGFNDNLKSAVVLGQCQTQDLKKLQAKSVFSCYLIGSQKSGKTSLSDVFLQKEPPQNYITSAKERSSVAVYKKPGSSDVRYLILTEILEKDAEKLAKDEMKMKK